MSEITWTNLEGQEDGDDQERRRRDGGGGEGAYEEDEDDNSETSPFQPPPLGASGSGEAVSAHPSDMARGIRFDLGEAADKESRKRYS